LHVLAFRRKETIPFPENIVLSTASENDLRVFKENRRDIIFDCTYFGDKIYADFEYFNMQKTVIQKVEMRTPVKAVKGGSDRNDPKEQGF
jgi:hypothetical protein